MQNFLRLSPATIKIILKLLHSLKFYHRHVCAMCLHSETGNVLSEQSERERAFFLNLIHENTGFGSLYTHHNFCVYGNVTVYTNYHAKMHLKDILMVCKYAKNFSLVKNY